MMKIDTAVSKHHANNLHVQLTRHREVRDTLASWRVLLGEIDLALSTKLGTPQAHAALHGAQHAGVPLAGIAALEFFEQSDSVESGIGWQPGDDLAGPNRTQRVFSGAPVALGAL
jgi:hypothetical protein